MATATISCAHGTTRETSGTLVREHFLVHRSENYRHDGWTVTHIGTGLAVVAGVMGRDEAIGYARRMANAARRGGLDLSISDPNDMAGAAGWAAFRDEGRKIRKEAQTERGTT